MKNEWFENVFLASLVKKYSSGKCYLTDKQNAICEKYMAVISGNKASFTTQTEIGKLYYYALGREFSLYKRGKYNVMYIGASHNEKNDNWINYQLQELNSHKSYCKKFLQDIENLEEMIREDSEYGEDTTELEETLNKHLAVWEKYTQHN